MGLSGSMPHTGKYPQLATIFFAAILSLTASFDAWASVTLAQAQKAENSPGISEQSGSPERKEIVIIGGDIAGLTAAYFLKHRNILLLEESNNCGGQLLSGSFGGFNYPKGIAYIGMPQGPIGAIVDELGLEPMEIPEPSEAFYYNGKFYLGSKALKQVLTENSNTGEYDRFVFAVKKIASAYSEADYSALPVELASMDKISAREWFASEKFPEVFVDIYESQALGIFGASLSDISALSFIPEIGFHFQTFESFIDNEDTANREITDELENPPSAYTFSNGLSELPEAMVKEMGGTVRTGSKVTRITSKEGLYEIAYVDGAGHEKIVHTHAVIMALPAPVSLKIGKNVLGREIKDILGKIKYSSYATVTLFSSEPIFDRAFNLGVGKGLPFSDLYDSSWVPRGHAPEMNNTKERALVAHVPEPIQDIEPLSKMTDQDLLESVLKGINGIFPNARSLIVGHDIHRVSLGLPVMAPGNYENLSTLNDLNQGRLILAGDYMIYPTVEAAAESGYIAALKVEQLLSQEESSKTSDNR